MACTRPWPAGQSQHTNTADAYELWVAVIDLGHGWLQDDCLVPPTRFGADTRAELHFRLDLAGAVDFQLGFDGGRQAGIQDGPGEDGLLGDNAGQARTSPRRG